MDEKAIERRRGTIRDHVINKANASITIDADAPTQGNSSHCYTVREQDGAELGVLRFQNGPINVTEDGKAHGINGLTHEVLLAIILDRLRGFQSGPYACVENAVVASKLEEALQTLEERTRKRVARGVEGTHKV